MKRVLPTGMNILALKSPSEQVCVRACDTNFFSTYLLLFCNTPILSDFRAQKVVSDMLVQLEKKNARIDTLEGVVLGLQEACVGKSLKSGVYQYTISRV